MSIHLFYDRKGKNLTKEIVLYKKCATDQTPSVFLNDISDGPVFDQMELYRFTFRGNPASRTCPAKLQIQR